MVQFFEITSTGEGRIVPATDANGDIDGLEYESLVSSSALAELRLSGRPQADA